MDNGKASLELDNLENGVHNVDVKYPGDDNYNAGEKSDHFNIDYKDSSPIHIIPHDVSPGENLTVDVILAPDAKGFVSLDVEGKIYTSPIDNGMVSFVISDLSEGNHTIKATYSGDDNYAPRTASSAVDIIKDSYYPMDISQNGKNIDVKLPDDAQGNVTVILDGNKFISPVVNGSASVYDPNLTVGLHNITVVYSGDNKYSSNKYDGQIDIVNAVVITAPVVEKYFSGTERFYVYLEDLYGQKISNASVSITINGVTYNRTTDENGTASIALNLEGAHYPVHVSFNGNDEFNASSITSAVLINPTIYSHDLVKVFRNATQYYALFLDSKGNPLVNTVVSFNINGVFYNRTTNATGWAKLNINLERGTYILTALNTVTGEKASYSIEVISLIIPEKRHLFKYYLNDTQYVAKIMGYDGNPVGAGEKIIFNIHGVFYERYTDANGYVKLNINLSPGSYILTAYYKDCMEGSHIHVLPVLSAEDLSMSYGDGSQFVAHLSDAQVNSYTNNEIKFNFNGVIYNRITDANGDAKLNINLQKGAYLITSTYIGDSKSNTIVVS